MSRTPLPIYSEYINPNGVVYIKVNDSKVWREAWVPKGRFVFEKALNRKIEPYEKIIKKNGKKQDFNLNNLILFNKKTRQTMMFEEKLGILVLFSTDWSTLHPFCKRCTLQKNPHAAKGYCTSCYPKVYNKSL